MTAPSAPYILVRTDGTSLYVRWQPVLNATDYNLYLSEFGGAFGVEAQFDDTDVNDDGWFFYISAPFAGQVNIKMTALNVLAEESGYSNEVQRNLSGGGGGMSPNSPTAALNHIRKGAGM